LIMPLWIMASFNCNAIFSYGSKKYCTWIWLYVVHTLIAKGRPLSLLRLHRLTCRLRWPADAEWRRCSRERHSSSTCRRVWCQKSIPWRSTKKKKSEAQFRPYLAPPWSLSSLSNQSPRFGWSQSGGLQFVQKKKGGNGGRNRKGRTLLWEKRQLLQLLLRPLKRPTLEAKTFFCRIVGFALQSIPINSIGKKKFAFQLLISPFAPKWTPFLSPLGLLRFLAPKIRPK